MRTKKDGTPILMDLSIQHHAAALGIRQGWRGDLPQTLEYYSRVAGDAARTLNYRQIDYCNNHQFDIAYLVTAIKAVNDLQAHLERVRLVVEVTA